MAAQRQTRMRLWIRRRTKVRVTNEQRRSLDLIKKSLSHRIFDSYQIFPVAKRFRRHHLDFVAVSQRGPQHLLLIRPYWGNKIEVRGYHERSTYHYSWKSVEENKKIECKIFWGKKLPSKSPDQGWKAVIKEGNELAIVLFTNWHPHE